MQPKSLIEYHLDVAKVVRLKTEVADLKHRRKTLLQSITGEGCTQHPHTPTCQTLKQPSHMKTAIWFSMGFIATSITVACLSDSITFGWKVALTVGLSTLAAIVDDNLFHKSKH